jgi:hypothetical protein
VEPWGRRNQLQLPQPAAEPVRLYPIPGPYKILPPPTAKATQRNRAPARVHPSHAVFSKPYPPAREEKARRQQWRPVRSLRLVFFLSVLVDATSSNYSDLRVQASSSRTLARWASSRGSPTPTASSPPAPPRASTGRSPGRLLREPCIKKTSSS